MCPICNKELNYKNKYNLQKAKVRNSHCLSCALLKRRVRIFSEKEKIQAANQLKKVTNKRPYYDIWIEKFGKEIADIKLKNSKKKKSFANSGSKNPMFGKPAPQGSGNGWSGWYNGWYFRSLRELSYMINVIEKNNLHYEIPDKKFQIPYIDYKGSDKTYIPDFIIEKNKIVEIKPIKLHKTPKVLAKKQAAEIFANNLNMKYELIDPPILSNEEIKKLYLDKKIEFLDKYDLKFRENYLNE